MRIKLFSYCVKKLTEDLTKHRIQSAKTDSTKVQYRNADGLNVLTVAKKEFTHIDHQTKFKESWVSLLLGCP